MRLRFYVIFTTGLILIISAVFVFLLWRKSPVVVAEPIPQRQAPFPGGLEGLNGAQASLSDFRGMSLVVNAWASWCPFCLKELHDLAALQREFGDKITIIAVNRGESKTEAAAYLQKNGFTENALLFLLDPADAWYAELGGFSMPETVLINHDGLIQSHIRGPVEQEEMRRRIQRMLDEG